MPIDPRARTRRPIALLVAGLAFVLVVLAVGWQLDDPPNYDRIEDGLYMGGRVESPPWRTRAVLNLCEQPDDYASEVSEHQPIPDAGPAPTLDWLRDRVEWIAAQRRDGRQGDLHCQQGVSRSGLVVAAYLMAEYGWTADRSVEFVRSKRSVTRPHPAFRPLLFEWEQELRARPTTAGAEKG